MAEYPGFVSDTSQARSYAVSPARVVNWYPEIVESLPNNKTRIAYYPTPGLALHVDCSAIGAGRGAFALDGRQWAVIGASLVEFHSDGTFEEYAGLADDGKPAFLVANTKTPSYLMISSADHGYGFDTGANVLTEITGGVGDDLVTPGAFNGCRMPAFLDRYLIALTPDSRTIALSVLSPDGQDSALNWDALDVSANLGSADKVKAIATDHEYLYQFGSKRTAIYTNTGNSDFPLAPVPGAFIESGIRAIGSLKRYANTLVYYGENEDGRGSVYMLDGFIPQRISTHTEEQAWCKYARDDDAIAFVQSRDGHEFYRLTFPTGNQTWVYDRATKMWHERAAWDAPNGVFKAQTQRYGAYSNGVYYVVGIDGKIYKEQNQTYTEDGRTIRRLRVPPVLAAANKLVFVSRLEIVIQPGIGLDGDPAAQGANPLMMLRYSGDGGRTWSNEMTARAGAIGDSEAVVAYDQLGSGRAWVPEISVTDPCNWVIVSAQVEMEAGIS